MCQTYANTSGETIELTPLQLHLLMRIGDAFKVLESKVNFLHQLDMK
jgi:hypothetical protein